MTERSVRVLVDPSVSVEKLSRTLAAGRLMLHCDARGVLRVLPAAQGGPVCEEPGCGRRADVSESMSGALLCPGHALARMSAVERAKLSV